MTAQQPTDLRERGTRGARHRVLQSQLKRELGAVDYPDSLREAARVIAAPPTYALSMPIGTLLSACRQVGDYRIRRLCKFDVPSVLRLRDLTDADRQLLLGRIVECLETGW